MSVALASQARTGAAVAVRDLSVVYERGAQAAVADVSLSLPRGEGLLVRGAPGAGKSSLLRGLLGLVPVVGEVEVLGRPPGDRAALRRIGFAPAGRPAPGGMRARALLALVAGLRGAADPARAAEALAARAGLALLDTRVERLEIEDARRLTFACALAGDPELLVLDDPWEFAEVTAEVQAALDRGVAVLATATERGGLGALLGRVRDLPEPSASAGGGH